MEIKILGSGCAKCNELERVAREAVERDGIDASVEKVTDFAQIMSYGVMSTPALVVNGEIKVAGRVPSVDDVSKMIASGGDCACGPESGGCGCGSGGGCC